MRSGDVTVAFTIRKGSNKLQTATSWWRSLVCLFIYIHIGHVYTIIFSLTLHLKLCNFVTICREKFSWEHFCREFYVEYFGSDDIFWKNVLFLRKKWNIGFWNLPFLISHATQGVWASVFFCVIRKSNWTNIFLDYCFTQMSIFSTIVSPLTRNTESQ